MNNSLAGMTAGSGQQGAALLRRTTNLEGKDVLTAIIAHFENTRLWSLYQCLLHLLLHLQPCPCSELVQNTQAGSCSIQTIDIALGKHALHCCLPKYCLPCRMECWCSTLVHAESVPACNMQQCYAAQGSSALSHMQAAVLGACTSHIPSRHTMLKQHVSLQHDQPQLLPCTVIIALLHAK